ncbi:PAS domain-containing protein [Fluviispira multicolorata]|uniref:PAS domain-containing protein n=1 Tax=Fluviispira multicolorata TaxID=2654512 RepID=A0A833JE66_9BACT|nr:PAS domain-containing protein [Fluviispira multicolorata]KAB8032220.1 PAS domain-containing protein [Fluviispira multicolorata]
MNHLDIKIKSLIQIETDMFQKNQFHQNFPFIILNIIGEIIYTPQSFINLIGYNSKELLGKSAYNFTLIEENEFISNAHYNLINNLGSITKISFRIIHKSRNVFWVEGTSTSVHIPLLEELVIISSFKKLNSF